MRSFTELTKLKVNMVTEAALEGPLGDQHASKASQRTYDSASSPETKQSSISGFLQIRGSHHQIANLHPLPRLRPRLHPPRGLYQMPQSPTRSIRPLPLAQYLLLWWPPHHSHSPHSPPRWSTNTIPSSPSAPVSIVLGCPSSGFR